MQLHELKSHNKKSKKRVGRGGKRGTTSGRGTKGQHSRSGRKLRPASRDLILRIPKLRGFANKPKSPKPVVVSLATLSAKLRTLSGGKMAPIVNLALLKQIGLVSDKYRGVVKILSDGEMAFPVTIRGCKVSDSAKAKIEKAGGTVK